jgi:hypothetical protein
MSIQEKVLDTGGLTSSACIGLQGCWGYYNVTHLPTYPSNVGMIGGMARHPRSINTMSNRLPSRILGCQRLANYNAARN